MGNKIQSFVGAGVVAIMLLLAGAFVVHPAISQIVGLAVAQTATRWNNLQDAAAGDNLTSGLLAAGTYFFDGTNFDRLRGDLANGIDIDVTRVQGTVTTAGNVTPADSFTNPTTAITSWALNGVFCGNCATPGWGRWFASPAHSVTPSVSPYAGRQGTPQNDLTVSAANTATSFTITGATNVRATLHQVAAFCSAGTSTLTVDDGVTTVFETPIGGIGITLFEYRWPMPLTSEANNQSIVVTLGACGASNTGTLIVQGDRE